MAVRKAPGTMLGPRDGTRPCSRMPAMDGSLPLLIPPAAPDTAKHLQMRFGETGGLDHVSSVRYRNSLGEILIWKPDMITFWRILSLLTEIGRRLWVRPMAGTWLVGL